MTKSPSLFWVLLVIGLILWKAPGVAASAIEGVTDGLCSVANSLSNDPSQNTCNDPPTQETPP